MEKEAVDLRIRLILSILSLDIVDNRRKYQCCAFCISVKVSIRFIRIIYLFNLFKSIFILNLEKIIHLIIIILVIQVSSQSVINFVCLTTLHLRNDEIHNLYKYSAFITTIITTPRRMKNYQCSYSSCTIMKKSI